MDKLLKILGSCALSLMEEIYVTNACYVEKSDEITVCSIRIYREYYIAGRNYKL